MSCRRMLASNAGMLALMAGLLLLTQLGTAGAQVAEEQVSALEQSTWLQDFDPVIAQSGLPQANSTHHLQALSSSLITPAANSSLPADSGIWDRLALPANLSALLNRTALGQRVGRTDRLPLPANMTQLSALLANMTERAVGLRGNLSGQLLGNLTARGAGLAAGMGAARGQQGGWGLLRGAGLSNSSVNNSAAASSLFAARVGRGAVTPTQGNSSQARPFQKLLGWLLPGAV
ncbi:hypothetical protein V8C86DRAFT_2873530 [Haematococcus lacustris]